MLRTSFAAAVLLSLLSTLTSAHTVITYPGWRGDNLQTNGTVGETSGLGVGSDNTYPFGMQWIYPCTAPSQTHPIPTELTFLGQVEECPCQAIAPSGR